MEATPPSASSLSRRGTAPPVANRFATADSAASTYSSRSAEDMRRERSEPCWPEEHDGCHGDSPEEHDGCHGAHLTYPSRTLALTMAATTRSLTSLSSASTSVGLVRTSISGGGVALGGGA
uniref:Uncharacterized protein n=1 Tax=Oryza sativa subsp. japonica TaxID=39947 RepID=Q6YTR4_ORYSJ|nr:hypothetical protein [Oryza sativa Japonica Group]BAD10727.1 hypothetical protein [Oryza sativa Japonica Group]